jgi:hypothetical protein
MVALDARCFEQPVTSEARAFAVLKDATAPVSSAVVSSVLVASGAVSSLAALSAMASSVAALWA